MPEEIDLNDEEEIALDRAWEALHAKEAERRAKESADQPKSGQPPGNAGKPVDRDNAP